MRIIILPLMLLLCVSFVIADKTQDDLILGTGGSDDVLDWTGKYTLTNNGLSYSETAYTGTHSFNCSGANAHIDTNFAIQRDIGDTPIAFVWTTNGLYNNDNQAMFGVYETDTTERVMTDKLFNAGDYHRYDIVQSSTSYIGWGSIDPADNVWHVNTWVIDTDELQQYAYIDNVITERVTMGTNMPDVTKDIFICCNNQKDIECGQDMENMLIGSWSIWNLSNGNFTDAELTYISDNGPKAFYDSLAPPPEITALGDVSGSGTNKTDDTTPTINATTDSNGDCYLRNNNSASINWTVFSTTGATEHEGTLPTSEALVIGYPQNITVLCNNSAGQDTGIIQYNITDGIEPSVILNEPDNNAVFEFNVNNTIIFKFTATDNHFTNLSCNLTIDGSVNQTDTSVSNGTISNWLPVTLNIGTFNWNVTCVDGQSNVNTSLTRILHVNDTISPTITILSPVNGTDYTSDSIDLNWSTNEVVNYAVYSLDNGTNISLSALCYQEFANISTTCGGLSTGSYANDSGWFGTSTLSDKVIDGNFSSQGRAGAASEQAFIWINYTQPDTALSSSKWRIKKESFESNLTITNTCWNQSPLQFQINSSAEQSTVCFDCYNGSKFIRMICNGDGGATSHYVNEEAMWWDISFHNVTLNVSDGTHNVTIWANDTYGNMGQSDYTLFSVTTQPTIANLYDVTGSGTKKTADKTPQFNLTTNATADCYESSDNSSWTICSTTGNKNHTCTISTAFKIGYPQNATVTCNNSFGVDYGLIQYNITETNVTVMNPSCYDNISLGGCFAINWSIPYLQINWSDNATIHHGNYSWNFTEYNITPIGSFTFNFTNPELFDVSLSMILNHSSIRWNLSYVTNLSIKMITNESYINILNLTANSTTLINLSFNVYNISARYVNWTQVYSTAEWSFNYTLSYTS